MREMLGIADRGLVFDLLETALKGDAAGALRQMTALYDGGADPVLVLQDLLELAHFLTRLKLAPSAGEGDPALEGERARGLALAEKLGIPALTRAWQMLLKGFGEAQTAPSPLEAAEMVLVRLAYVADLPSPAELVRDARRPACAGAAGAAASAAARRARAPARRALAGDGARRALGAAHAAAGAGAGAGVARSRKASSRWCELFEQHREALLRAHLLRQCASRAFRAGPDRAAPDRGRAARSQQPARPASDAMDRAALGGQRLGRARASRPCASRPKRATQALRSEAAQHPLVRAVLDAFPGARIEAVRELAPHEPAASRAAPSADERREGDEFR